MFRDGVGCLEMVVGGVEMVVGGCIDGGRWVFSNDQGLNLNPCKEGNSVFEGDLGTQSNSGDLALNQNLKERNYVSAAELCSSCYFFC